MVLLVQVLQKDATRQLPRFAFHAKTAQQYLASRAWMLGLGLDVAGALLMIAAYAMAPVSMFDFKREAQAADIQSAAQHPAIDSSLLRYAFEKV